MANPKGNPNWKDKNGKGVSGNPKGKPPGTLEILPYIQKAFHYVNPETGNPYIEDYARSYVAKHVAEARTDALDRYHGKPASSLDITSKGKEIGTLDSVLAACEAARLKKSTISE